MEKIIRVEKENDSYDFIIDKLGNLIYKNTTLEGSELLHKELISSKSDEMSLFVDDNNIYILFKEKEDLKCAIIRDKHINIGTLYTYVEGNYKINNSNMFIDNGNINILAVLSNNDDKVRDVIIHYVYINEDVKENTIKVLNKDQRYKNYVGRFNKDNIKIFYISIDSLGKERLCYRNYTKHLWQDENKIMDVYGSVIDMDIKENHENLYVAIVYNSYSINVLKVCVYNENLDIQREKIYYSVDEITSVKIVEDEDDMFIMWNEGDKKIISSSLKDDNNIRTYSLPHKNIMMCNIYEVKNYKIKERSKLLRSKEKDQIEFLDLKDIFKNFDEDEKNIVCYNKDTLKILSIQREEKEKIMHDMQDKIQNLKKMIKEKESKLIEVQKKYGENMVRGIKEEYENHILELLKGNSSVEKENKEIKEKIELIEENMINVKKEKEDKDALIKQMEEKFEKNLMEIEHIKQENHKILEEEENKKQKEIDELKNIEHVLREKIESLESCIEQKDMIIEDLNKRINEKENKSILQRILKR